MTESKHSTRVLLVEDDPVSRSFLAQALETLPATVDAAENIASAVQLAVHSPHQLWLIDAHLPDGNGVECLRQLRRTNPMTPALAITAEAFRDERTQLAASGFHDVLQKPITVKALQAAVNRVLNQTAHSTAPVSCGKLPIWDVSQALAAVGGNHATLAALTQLFHNELPDLHRQITLALTTDNSEAARAVLHKLKASCSFVGASRLLQATHELSNDTTDLNAWQRFNFAVTDALTSIADHV